MIHLQEGAAHGWNRRPRRLGVGGGDQGTRALAARPRRCRGSGTERGGPASGEEHAMDDGAAAGVP